MSAFERRLTTASMMLLLLCAGCSTRSMELPVVNATANPLSIQDAAVAPAIDGMPYNTALSATGGTPGYQWAITTGSLPAGLALNPSSGSITGVASLTGTAKFNVLVSDHSDPVQTTSASISLSVVSPFALPQAALPAAEVGTSYSSTLPATGGTAPYNWFLTSGALPPGLVLSASSGMISGVPTTAGTYPFAVTANDSSSPVQSKTTLVSIIVSVPLTAPTAQALSLPQAALPPGEIDFPYIYKMQVTGGIAPYHFALSSGSLPSGLTLNAATGFLYGIPTKANSFAFSITVTDSSQPAQSQTTQFSLVVAPQTLMLRPQALPSGQVNVGYAYTLQATGGSTPYHWSIPSGALPSGIVLNATTGSLSGTPTTAGTSTFTLAVSDSSKPIQSKTEQISLIVAPAVFSFESIPLPSGQVNVGYNSALTATGGIWPYHWKISSGNLPTGVTLNASTGTLSGIPTTAGTSAFTVAVTDSSTPIQSRTAALSLVIAAPPLSFQQPSLPSGQVNVAYTHSLLATGGTTPYSWSISSGALPAGISLNANTGVVAGTPNTSGVFTFAIRVTDSSRPTQSQTTQTSIVIAPAVLSFPQPSLPSAQVNHAYTYSLLATGGTAPYRWSISSGALPAGMTLNTATGVIAGTPTTSGISAFTVSLTDSGRPAQSQTLQMSLPVAAAPATPAPPSAGTTWYVRPDGGSRYSSNMQNGQCNGKSDTAYPGHGTNQPCAFNDVRYLWQDGSYTTNSSQSAFPAYGWIGNGGDTYLIRGSLSSNVSWRIGYPSNSDVYDSAVSHYWGVAGDPYDSGAPPPLSGTASQHTRILGENFASCHAPSAKTQLHGGYGVNAVLTMTDVSYVDIACLDITDFSSCGRASQTNTCNSTIGQLSDYATNGISWSRTSTNDTVTDVSIHGLASAGMIGPTGDSVVFSYVNLIGNASSGWNADAGDGTTGTGTLLMQHYNISWNGCAEEYPIVDALPYQDCTDDNVGGYGDGFGTATTPSSPAWNVTFDQGIVTYNTQDGLDSLHLIGSGSSVTVTRTQAYGNMGQQIKVGGASGTAVNNLIVTNCNAMRQPIPGTPEGYNSRLSDYCRAADTGIVLKVGPQTRLTYDFNTLYSASATAIEIDCDTTNGPCNATSTIDFRNNIFVGFLNDKADGYPSGGTGGYSNPVYNGAGVDFFGNSESLFTNNFTFHPSSAWTCPANHELAGVCGDPRLADEAWHVYGAPDMTPGQSSPAVAAGVAIPGITLDYAGVMRPSSPTIGGLQP